MARRQPMTHGDMAVAASAPRAFRHPGWLFEPDYDGLRALARGGSTAWIVSTEGEDLARLFPEVRRALVRLPSCLLDGELVVTDFEGRPNGARLRQRCALEDREKIALASMGRPASFFAFDLVGVGGEDLREVPLLERKLQLKGLLLESEVVRYVEHVQGDGYEMLGVVEAEDMDAVLARRADSPYRAGKSCDWMRIRAASGRTSHRARRR